VERNVRFEQRLPNGRIVRIVQGDLTAEKVDAIVNAANERLAHGGGVAGAIVSRGGREIQEESHRWVAANGPVPTGSAAITGAGRLVCRFVIHAVGPVYGSGEEDERLASAIRSSLDLASENELRSISIPAISSGIFGFPKDLCAKVFLGTLASYFEEHPASSLREVNLCNIDDETSSIFEREARAVMGDDSA
jgi:putative ATPase